MIKYISAIIALVLLLTACTGTNPDGLTPTGSKITRWIRFLEPQVRENIFPAFSSVIDDKIYLSAYKVQPRKGNKQPIVFILEDNGTLIKRVDIPTDFDFNSILAQETHGGFLYLLVREGLTTGRYKLVKLDKDASLVRQTSLPVLSKAFDYRMKISHDQLIIATRTEDRIYTYHYNPDLMLIGEKNFFVGTDNWQFVGDKISVLTSESDKLLLRAYSPWNDNVASFQTSLDYNPDFKLVKLSEEQIVLFRSGKESAIIKLTLPDMELNTLKLNRFIRNVTQEETVFVLVTDNKNKLNEGINLIRIDSKLHITDEYSIFKANNYRFNSLQDIEVGQYLISGAGFFPNSRLKSIPRIFLIEVDLHK